MTPKRRTASPDELRGAAMDAVLEVFALAPREPWTVAELAQVVEERRVRTWSGPTFMMNRGRLRRALHWLTDLRPFDVRRNTNGAYRLTPTGLRSIALARIARGGQASQLTIAEVRRKIDREAKRILAGRDVGPRGATRRRMLVAMHDTIDRLLVPLTREA